jgi:hypothetical protein
LTGLILRSLLLPLLHERRAIYSRPPRRLIVL